MSSEMIERVALAIENANECRNCGALIRGEMRSDACCNRPDWQEAAPENKARAAIEAMGCDPTPRMIEAAHIADPLGCDIEEADAPMIYGKIWVAMIDAALSPTKDA